MILSLILAWLTVLLVIVTAFRYIVRVSKSVKLNRIFHKAHIPVGIMLDIYRIASWFACRQFCRCKIIGHASGTCAFYV